MSRLPVHSGPDTALLPEARTALVDLVARGLDHRWVMHHRSSQAFALNLFAPLHPAGVRSVFALFGFDVTETDPAEFEYSDPNDRLGEARPKSSHRTQVDVVLRGTTVNGQRVIALIEVKFTETDFGHCSAYGNPANPRRDVCRSPGLFGGQPDACFQLANHGTGRRRYDKYLNLLQTVEPCGAGDAGGCLVRGSLNQPMRNLALAHLLVHSGEADHVIYALCAPAAHPTIWRRFGELAAAFPDNADRKIRALTAELIAGLHDDNGAALAAQYPIEAIEWPITPSAQRS